jgi:Cu+-exporting ATPase
MNHHGSHTPAAAEQAVKDPVCGMNVDPKSAIRYEYQDKTWYFCSAQCQSKFQAEPGKFMQQSHGCCS